MEYKLSTPDDASQLIASLLSSDPNPTLEVTVSEKQCFKDDGWLQLGVLSLKPAAQNEMAVLQAAREGSFEWSTPETANIEKQLCELLDIQSLGRNYDKARARLPRILDSIACAGPRLGLVHPTFDAGTVELMPFRRACTIISDTSGVAQGALNFVARYLHPVARIKVPAIVHMEIINQIDRFLSTRRASKNPNPSTMLLEHVKSLGAQRVLLKLELQPDTEIEHSAAFGDPLRNAFQNDTDPELAGLNLSLPLKSYCDRLIVEAARQHQAQATPGHPVLLLTSDQGLARMALAEGIKPLFFQSIKGDDFFGRLFTGAMFNPFTGSICRTPLVDIIWELATIFGLVRLATPTGGKMVEVTAIGGEITWAPFHSHDDLLWLSLTGNINNRERPFVPLTKEAAIKGEIKPKKPSERSTERLGFYKINVSSLLSLIDLTVEHREVSERTALANIRIVKESGLSEYRKFLESGGLIDAKDHKWHATDRLDQLAAAIHALDYSSIAASFKMVPSFAAFADELATRESIRNKKDTRIPERSLPSYELIAELCCLGAPIAHEGFFSTLNNPVPSKFAAKAIMRFHELAAGEHLIAVGEWLEAMIRSEGIHPLNTRARLEEAQHAGLLRVLTEGSTLDTKHDDRLVRVLTLSNGKAAIETVYLYRGDFLVPTKSSTSLRIEGAGQ